MNPTFTRFLIAALCLLLAGKSDGWMIYLWLFNAVMWAGTAIQFWGQHLIIERGEKE